MRKATAAVSCLLGTFLVVSTLWSQSTVQQVSSENEGVFLSSADADSNGIRFHVLGDQGVFPAVGEDYMQFPSGGVGKLMSEVADRNPIDFVLSMGDMFYYPDGLRGENDPRLDIMFNYTYGYDSLRKPFKVVLGNHDCKNGADTNIDLDLHGKLDQWYFPDTYYKEVVALDNGKKALFVHLNSCLLTCIEANNGDEDHECKMQTFQPIDKQAILVHFKWIKEVLESYANDDSIAWRSVVIHTPFFSAGKSHGDSPSLKTTLLDLLVRTKVDFIFSGHDHNMQYLKMNINDYKQNGVADGLYDESGCGMYGPDKFKSRGEVYRYEQGSELHQFLIGASGKVTSICTAKMNKYFEFGFVRYGFAEVVMNSTTFDIKYYNLEDNDVNGEIIITRED